jgi:hypothetical protein
MVTFETITKKDVSAPYIKNDYNELVIKGTASYNKENKLTEANGEVKDAEGKNLGNFNLYGSDEYARISFNASAKDGDAVYAAAKATLADLVETYPQE